MVSTLTIKDALVNAGIEAVEVETVKNGVICQGFRISTGSNISPVVYYSPDETAEAFVEKVLNVVAKPLPEFKVNEFLSKENLLKNSYLCIQKRSEENILKRDYLDLEIFIRVKVDGSFNEGTGTIKLNSDILEVTKLNENEIFEAAIKNSLQNVMIKSMADMLGMPEEFFDDVPFYIGTYKDRIHGAALLALPDVINDFCKEKGVSRCYILPSSSEEILLLPGENYDVDGLVEMVNSVNITEVAEELRLEPSVYVYDTDGGEVSIATTYSTDKE